MQAQSAIFFGCSSTRFRCFLFALLIAMSTVGLIGSDIYLPALPMMGAFFQQDVSHMQWTLTLYLCGLAVGQLIVGPLSDQWGRKPLAVCGMLLYTGAALACTTATSYEGFLCWRAIQALGACTAMVTARAVVVDCCDAAESAKVFSLLFPFIGLSPAIAPMLGGGLAECGHWTWCFYAVSVYGALTAMGIVVGLPETLPRSMRATTAVRKRFSGYLLLLRHHAFIAYALGPCMAYLAYFAYLTQSPYVFADWGYSAQQVGFLYINLSLSYVCGNLCAKRLLKQWTLARVLRLGYILFAVGGVSMVGASFFAKMLPPLMLSMSVMTFANGFLIPLGTAGALSACEGAKGAGAGLLGCLQLSCAALASSVVGGLTQNSVVRLTMLLLAIAALAGTMHGYFTRGVLMDRPQQ